MKVRITKVPDKSLNARKWHGDGGPLNLFYGGGEYELKLSNGLLYNPNDKVPGDVVVDNFVQSTSHDGVKPALENPGRIEQVRKSIVQEDDSLPVTVQKDSFLERAVVPKDELVTVDKILGEVHIPERDPDAYFLMQAQKINDELKAFNPKGKTRDEIRVIQQELADDGYYSDQLSGKSKEEIRAIQRRLINRGLLSNEKNADGTYKEADGIAGKKTKAAYNKYNVDGIWGERSNAAYERSMRASEKNDWSKNYSANGIDQCATWVTRKYESVLGQVSKQNGVFGNAWTMPLNIARSGGGEVLFNLYSHGFENVRTPKELRARTQQRMNEETFDIHMLRPGDVVGIFYANSSNHQRVLDEGTTYNTHVGIVTGYDKDGMPIIEHNMSGNVIKDRADKLQYKKGSSTAPKFGITTVSRPRNEGVETYPWKSSESKYEVELPDELKGLSTEEKMDNLNSYMDAMAGGADVIGRIYGNADMDAVQRIATAVLRHETGFMQNTESSRTGKEGRKVRLRNLAKRVLGKDLEPESRSSDLGKFKLNTLKPSERAFLGISDASDLENPEKAGLAAMYTLAKNYDYFVRYANENPQLGLTKQDIEDLTALSYNQGMVRLYGAGTVKDDSTGKRFVSKSKIEKIRQSAESDREINDFSATTPGRMAKEYPVTEGVMKLIYKYNLLGLGDKSSSYTNQVRQALKNVKVKRGKE